MTISVPKPNKCNSCIHCMKDRISNQYRCKVLSWRVCAFAVSEKACNIKYKSKYEYL